MENMTVTFVERNRVELIFSGIPHPSFGELLLKTQKTLISQGTELAVLAKADTEPSVWTEDFPYPYQPGYANVAVVEDVGEDVPREWIGKRVFSDLGHTAWGTKKVEEVILVPDDISDEQMLLSVFACIALCGVRRARLRLGESAAVFGLGLIGQMIAQFSALAGAIPIIAIERSPKRRKHLPEPERFCLCESVEEALSYTQQITNGRLCDVAFEATGDAKLIATETMFLHPFGRLAMVSSPRESVPFHFHDFCNRRSLEIIGAHNLLHTPVETYENPWTRQRDIELYLDMLRTKRVVVDGYVERIENSSDAIKVYEKLICDPRPPLGVAFGWN